MLRQNSSVRSVTAHYAIATGKTSSSFEDGVLRNRPSSEEFWARVTGLDKSRAVALVVAMATEAGTLAEQDAAQMLEGLRRLVTAYIEKADGSGEVDWDWVVSRTMRDKKEWAAEDRDRHRRALRSVEQGKQALADVVAIAADAPDVDDSEAVDIELAEYTDDEL